MTALMTEIEKYCGCYISYMDNIEVCLNHIRQDNSFHFSDISTKHRIRRPVIFTNMAFVSDSSCQDSNGNDKNIAYQHAILSIIILIIFMFVIQYDTYQTIIQTFHFDKLFQYIKMQKEQEDLIRTQLKLESSKGSMKNLYIR